MKPRSDTNAKARPQRRASQVGAARNADKSAHCETTLSRELPGDEDSPADRGACEKHSATQGSEQSH